MTEALKVNTYEDYIFGGVINQGEGMDLERKRDFLVNFPDETIFNDEYNVLHILINSFSNINITDDFLRLFLQTNRAKFSNSREIDLSKYSLGENDPYVEFVNSVIEVLRVCRNLNVSDSVFITNMEMYKMEYVTKEALGVLEESAIILSEGLKQGYKTKSGYADMREVLNDRLNVLDNIVEKKERKGIIIYGVNDNDEDQSGKLKKVSEYGVKDLDNHLGGIYEGEMVSILAPSKGGKSRFATQIVHNAVTGFQVNTAMWSIENGYKGWESLARARHFNWLYNRNITDVTQKRIINSDMIRKGELPADLVDLELASWDDLRTNKEYGTLINIDEDFKYGTYLDILKKLVKENNVKLICLDYPALIGEGPKGWNDNQVVAQVYKDLLQFLKNNKVAGIFPAQWKQSVVTDLGKLDPEELANVELRDSAGISYEVIKTPDVNLALYGTPEDIKNGDMKLLSVPSRNSQHFDPIDLYVDAGTCTFVSV